MCVEVFGKYGVADINHRFEFIYKNYSDFDFMIDGYKNNILDNIRYDISVATESENEYERDQSRRKRKSFV